MYTFVDFPHAPTSLTSTDIVAPPIQQNPMTEEDPPTKYIKYHNFCPSLGKISLFFPFSPLHLEKVPIGRKFSIQMRSEMVQ